MVENRVGAGHLSTYPIFDSPPAIATDSSPLIWVLEERERVAQGAKTLLLVVGGGVS